MFTLEMLIFAIFAEKKINFEQWQFQRMDVILSKFCLIALFLLWALEEICFKDPKSLLDEYFSNWNVHFWYFSTKNQPWAIPVSVDGIGFHLILFIWAFFVASIRRKLFCSVKSSVGQIFLPLKCSFLIIFYK